MSAGRVIIEYDNGFFASDKFSTNRIEQFVRFIVRWQLRYFLRYVRIHLVEILDRVKAMQIIITGGAGFLGQRLATVLLTSSIDFEQLVLVDVVMPTKPGPDERVVCQQTDLTKTGAVQTLITHRTGIVFHLAAIVSSHAEKDFDLGWTVNLDVTRQLLEACRPQKRGIRFVFASSLAVYGGTLPDIVVRRMGRKKQLANCS